jgi:multimeric flavodoxin WrbA
MLANSIGRREEGMRKDKRVIGISMGRKMGNSEILLKHALKAVQDEGCEVGFLRLHDYYIKPCEGCELCSILGRSNQPLRCKHGWDEDDFYAITEQIKSSEGIILAAPAYHLMPPGISTVLLNRLHCVGINAGASETNKKQICATIGVGGSDWISLAPTILNFTATEMCCSQMNLVDQMFITGVPAKSMIATRQDALDRAVLLGKHVAMELGKPGRATYHGHLVEACPICHTELLLFKEGRVKCPICDVAGDPVIQSGRISSISWDGGIEISRWSKVGRVHHDDVMLKEVKMPKRGYEFTDEQKAAIERTVAKWVNFLSPVMPPEREHK